MLGTRATKFYSDTIVSTSDKHGSLKAVLNKHLQHEWRQLATEQSSLYKPICRQNWAFPQPAHVHYASQFHAVPLQFYSDIDWPGNKAKKLKLHKWKTKTRRNAGNPCCHSAENLLSSRLLSKKMMIKMYTIIMLHVGAKFACHLKERTWTESIRE